MEERFKATLKLAELPRNSSKTRVRNRCECFGPSARLLSQARSMSRIALRELGSLRPTFPAL
jgi:small subunit ribosomal protein S14